MWLCTKCGYTHNGEEPPKYCPICQASSDDFVEDTQENRMEFYHLTHDTH